MKKRGTRGKKIQHRQPWAGADVFFLKTPSPPCLAIVVPEKNGKTIFWRFPCPKFSIPLSYSTRLSMHLFFFFFCLRLFRPNELYIYISIVHEKGKKINNHSRRCIRQRSVKSSYWNFNISLSILINNEGIKNFLLKFPIKSSMLSLSPRWPKIKEYDFKFSIVPPPSSIKSERIFACQNS